MQSGHAGRAAWHSSSADRGLPLTFEEQEERREAAVDTLRRTLHARLQEHLPELRLPRLTERDPDPDREKDSEAFKGAAFIDDLFDTDLWVDRRLGGMDLQLRPRLSADADTDEAEARTGARLQWGYGLNRPKDDLGLRTFVFADVEGRFGIEDAFSGSRSTGGHDIDAGLGLSVGAWRLSVHANLETSGFADPEGDGDAQGYLGYAVRF